MVSLAAMTTVGATVDVTVIVMAFDAADGCVTQVSDDVMITVTTSLFASVAFWYVGLFVPTLAPFNCH